MKVLLVRVSSLGDVLHNMPVVADILRHFPHAQIDWVVEEAYVELVQLHPGVRRIIPFSLRRWRRGILSSHSRAATWKEMKAFKTALQAEQYDVILDTQGLLKTGVIMGLAHGKLKVGLANGTEGSGYEALSRFFHDRSVPVNRRTHAVERGRIVAASALNYTDNSPPDFGLIAPELQPTWLPDRPYAVFFHGTARNSKKWAADQWITVGKHLNQCGYPVLLAWGNATEFEEAKLLAAQISDAQVLPKLTMMEALVLAQRAALAIGVDTGLTHIAAAFYRPVIELYADSPRWKTEGNWSENIINLGDQGKPPQCAEVIAAADNLIRLTTLNT